MTQLGSTLQVGPEELTWRWLMALRVRQMRLEGADESDRNTAVSALRRIVADEATKTADDVFAHLAERSGAWASSAADLDQALVRRELSGFPTRPDPFLSSCLVGTGRHSASPAGEGIPPDLRAGDGRLELDRSEERVRLAEMMNRAGRTGSRLAVTGEPDVGKSAQELLQIVGYFETALSRLRRHGPLRVFGHGDPTKTDWVLDPDPRGTKLPGPRK
ncbi:hypothetical protein [Streptomyces sp. SAS_275]|uniref:hypothetical protein n=1 Tax=Streptomyces sp. SAS_275 TaxID=3412746 RepID=UPI00403CC3DC